MAGPDGLNVDPREIDKFDGPYYLMVFIVESPRDLPLPAWEI